MNKKSLGERLEGFFSLKALLSQRKGFEEEGMQFNVKQIGIIILFLVVLGVVMVLLFPKLTAQKSSEAATGFGKYIWDILMGGK